MKLYTSFRAVFGMSVTALALRLVERDSSSSTTPRVVPLDFRRHNNAKRISSRDKTSWMKRQMDISEDLTNLGNAYWVNLTLGSPPQPISLTIDTGSSDMWTNTPNSTLCSQSSYCIRGGTYDPSNSSTVAIVDTDFNITYVDGSGASGSLLSDEVGFGDVQLTEFKFGVGYESQSPVGVLGVGYQILEEDVESGNYPNLPFALVNAGFINTPAFSLWLNDLHASTGTILFGGVDTEKYHGPLTSVPILPEEGGYMEFVVALTGISMTNTDKIAPQEFPVAALLDSGTTLVYLPEAAIKPIYKKLKAKYSRKDGVAYVPCSTNLDQTITFNFSSPTISVPMNELIAPRDSDDDSPEYFDDGTPACRFGIVPSLGTSAILGDTFLRSAYVVYDLDSNEIALAQTNYNATLSNIKEIVKNQSIPGATAAPSAVSQLPIQGVKGAATATGRMGIAATGTAKANAASEFRAKLAAVGVMGTVVAAAL